MYSERNHRDPYGPCTLVTSEPPLPRPHPAGPRWWTNPVRAAGVHDAVEGGRPPVAREARSAPASRAAAAGQGRAGSRGGSWSWGLALAGTRRACNMRCCQRQWSLAPRRGRGRERNVQAGPPRPRPGGMSTKEHHPARVAALGWCGVVASSLPQLVARCMHDGSRDDWLAWPNWLALAFRASAGLLRAGGCAVYSGRDYLVLPVVRTMYYVIYYHVVLNWTGGRSWSALLAIRSPSFCSDEHVCTATQTFLFPAMLVKRAYARKLRANYVVMVMARVVFVCNPCRCQLWWCGVSF
jgi:hypothetical protein